jgi:IclR family pca regulon transcriptional regulator
MSKSRKRSSPATVTSADPNYMLSLARGLSVIHAFENSESALSVAEVARRSDISRAAARRCLHTLACLGYVVSAGGKFELAPKVLTLGYAYLGSARVSRAAQPVLERVSERLQESCSMSVMDGNEIVYVARAASRRIVSISLSTGSRLPAYCTSMGRILLAFGGDERLKQYFAAVKLAVHTPHTITKRADLLDELQRIRSAGYALVDQELEIGLRSVAVPVRRADASVVAAINVGVQAARVDCKTMISTYVPVLQKAATEIGHAIGHAID